jgi:UDP:flavonoid glycosyltransferase YjiC (YdhE family)
MRILIVTAGSRGDVAPYTGLGRRLQDAGHQVALAAHDAFAGLVGAGGLEHRSLPGDPLEMVRARTRAPTPEDARAVFATFLDGLGDGVLAAAADRDVLLTAFGPAPLSRLVARALGLPSLGVYLVPGVPTREFPPPGRPAPDPPTPDGNLAAGRELLAQAGGLYADVLTRLHDQLGRPGGTPIGAVPPDDWPICHGYSPTVLPRPADWPDRVDVTGYWWPAYPTGWRPPDDLVEFLDGGPPPVYFGFGSMAPDQAERLAEVITEAAGRARVRAVVQSGWAGLRGAGADVHTAADVPHEWLFPRMAAVVHHAGAGTTGAGLRAGVPAVPVPVLLDQPFWADRLHRLGVAPRVLPLAGVTADDLAEAVRTCVDDPRYRRRAAELARRIGAEDGAAAVLARIDRL